MSGFASLTSLKTVYVPFFLPMKKIIDIIRKGFEHASIVAVRGFPVRVFCLADPEHIAQLYADPQAGMTKYPRILPRVRWVIGKGMFIMSGGSEWREKRQAIQPAFRRPELGGHLRCIADLTEEMLEEWAPKAVRGEVFDAFKPMRLLITRINMQMFFSKRFDEAELEEMEKETHFIEENFVRPSPLAIPFPGNLRFRRYARRLRARMHRLIDERRETTLPPSDLLSHLMGLRDPKTDKPWKDHEIVDEILSIYFGASVVSATLAWALYAAVSHSDVQQKIAQEGIALSAEGRPAPEHPVRLPYTEAALKEVLRLYPSAWGYPRWAEHDLNLGDVTIPAESLVIPLVYLIHRDRRLWKDPEVFLPERFQSDGDPHAPIHPFAYLPFSAGPRACLGAGLAPIILQTVLSMVLSRYRISYCPRFHGDPVAEFGFGIMPQDEIRVRIDKDRRSEHVFQ